MLLGLETTLLRLTALSEFGVLIYQKSIAEDWNKLWGQDEEGDVIRMLCGLELVSHRLCCPPAEIFLLSWQLVQPQRRWEWGMWLLRTI